jgi:hypothetical protein
MNWHIWYPTTKHKINKLSFFDLLVKRKLKRKQLPGPSYHNEEFAILIIKCSVFKFNP